MSRLQLVFRSAVVAVACALAISARAQTPVDAGYRDFSFGTTASSTPTGEKPESKLWFNDGRWWGSLYSVAGGEHRIYQFDLATQSWTDTGVPLDSRPNSKADVLWDEPSQKLYVVSHVFTTTGSATSIVANWGKLFRYSYNSANSKYTLDATFPVDVTRGRSETLTIAKDGIGRLWVTYVEGSRVKINWSTTDDSHWSTPVNLPVAGTETSVKSDDISAIVAFPNGDIGVMWSNQLTDKTSFALHLANDLPGAWQAVETVLPNPGCSGACADDHFNLKTDQLGRLYAAVKTSLTNANDPLSMLAVRDVSGWTLYRVGRQTDHLTRSNVFLNEEEQMIYYVATTPEAGGAIHLKTSPMTNIQFDSGIGEAVIESSLDSTINNVTSTRQNVTTQTGLLLVASDQNTHRYLHAFLPLGAPEQQPPQTPTNLTAVAASSTRIDLTWSDRSDNETTFQIERAEGSAAFQLRNTVGANVTLYQDVNLLPSTSYTYRVRATNAQGVSAYSNTAVATTPAAGGGGSAGNLKAITFEGGSLTGTSGADQVTGTVTLETAQPIKGAFAARIAAGSSSLDESFTAAADFYLSFYFRLNSIPPADARIVLISSAGTTIGNLQLRPTGKLRLRSASTAVGNESVALISGRTYRIGIQQKSGSGADAMLQAFLAIGDDAFGPPFASTTTGTWTSAADRVRLGPTTSAAIDAVVDDVRLDNASMPAPGGPTDPPVAPQDPQATALSPTEVLVQWLDASNNETAFQIERSDAGGAFAPVTSVAANTTSYTDRNLTPATQYIYRLRTESSGALSDYSDSVTVTTLANTPGPPAAPTNLAAQADLPTHVNLSWVDNSDNEVTFLVERAGSSLVFAEIGTSPADQPAFSDATVQASTTYSYRVRARNTNGDSSYSNVSTVTTPAPLPTTPAAPSGLTATAVSASQVHLSWTDNSTTETFFEIFRGTGADIFGTAIATVNAEVTSFDDNTVAALTTYSYHVRSGNAQGVSTMSNQADATTPAASGTTLIKAATFENGSLTHATTGVDAIAGAVTLENTGTLKGAFSARVAAATTYLEERFNAQTDVYVSAYVRLVSVPASDVRLILVSNAGTSVGNIVIRSTGRLRLRADATSIGVESAPLVAGQLYRVGIRQKVGTGANGVLEAFLATGDAAFAAPFASTTTGAWVTQADRVRLGATTATAVTVVIDEVRVDAATMPGPTP